MKLLRALLRLYPRTHVRAYGEEMLEVAEHRMRASGGGPAAMIGAAAGLAGGAAGVWMDRFRREVGGMGRGWGLDARFVARSLWGARGYLATAVLVLACAVAVNATVYSYVRGTLLAEPPYPDADRIMIVWGSATQNGQRRDVISGSNYIDLQERVGALSPIAAFHHDAAYLMVGGRPEVIDALEVSVDFFEVLGVEPALGRLFDETDRMSGGAESVVVTYAFWRDRMGADPEVLGTTLDLETDPRTVIGVLPEGFEFIAPAPLFIPLHDDLLAAEARSRIHFHVLGRLAPGATVADADRELAAVMEHVVTIEPGYRGWSFLVEPFHEVAVEAVRPVIVILGVTAALVLLIALVNLATLFRIRAMARSAELGVRAALGASRLTLVRVLALETGGLAAVGAALGLLAAPFILDEVTQLVPTWIAIPDSAARVPVLLAVLDPGVAAVAFVSAVVGALALTGPSFLSAIRGADPARAAGGRVKRGVRSIRALVGVQLAVATVLCIGAALTARTAANLLSEDVGVESDGLLTMMVGDVWGLDAPGIVQYYRDVVEQVERIPGVREAGVMDYVDFQAEDDFAGIDFLDGELQEIAHVREEWRRVDEGLFEAAGMRMVAGRRFESTDFEGRPRVAIVNEAFAAKHYAGRDPIGQYLSAHPETYGRLEIVGVVADVRSLGPANPAPAMLYAPNQGEPRGTQGLYVRVAGDPMSYAPRVQDAIWSVDPSQPVTTIVPMSELVDQWVAIPRATRALVGSLATLAWLLSSLGVFGVVAYAVRTRRAELGIRLALGASPDRLEIDQLRAISPVVVLGIGAGLALGALAARGARSILYGVSPLDPLSWVAAVTAVCLAAFVATWLPARRAGRIDPTEVIRTE